MCRAFALKSTADTKTLRTLFPVKRLNKNNNVMREDSLILQRSMKIKTVSLNSSSVALSSIVDSL